MLVTTIGVLAEENKEVTQSEVEFYTKGKKKTPKIFHI